MNDFQDSTTSDVSFEYRKKRCIKSIKKRLKRIRNGILQRELEFQESQKYELTRHYGDLVKANFYALKRGMTSIEVQDWDNENRNTWIALDPDLEPVEQVAAFFEKAKKQRRGQEPLTKIINKMKEDEKKWSEVLAEVELVRTVEGLKKFEIFYKKKEQQKNISKKSSAAKGVYRFISQTGIEILVGKTSQDNDILTFQLARACDTWLHIQNFPGSHVVVRKQAKEIDHETILNAAQLAVYFSKARHIQGLHEVIIAKRSDVFRKKGAPKGKVLLSAFKTLFIKLDIPTIEEIKHGVK